MKRPVFIAAVPKVCFADPKSSVTISQGICGYISVMASFKCTYCFIEIYNLFLYSKE